MCHYINAVLLAITIICPILSLYFLTYLIYEQKQVKRMRNACNEREMRVTKVKCECLIVEGFDMAFNEECVILQKKW